MRNFCVLLICAVVIPFSSAIADNKASSYSTTTDADGTRVTIEKSSSDKTGWTGTKKFETDEKTTVDPKGPSNKKVSSTHFEQTTGPRGELNEKTIRKHANGTAETTVTENKTSKHWLDNGETTTSRRAHTVDPKGLGNKQTLEIEKKTERYADGSRKERVTKTIDGDAVSDTETTTR